MLSASQPINIKTYEENLEIFKILNPNYNCNSTPIQYGNKIEGLDMNKIPLTFLFSMSQTAITMALVIMI